jgi:hypothetical protein
MDNRYWIGRKRSAMKMARGAATAEARLIHYDLAGRYSVKAAQFQPLAAAASSPPAAGARTALHAPGPEARPPQPRSLRPLGERS